MIKEGVMRVKMVNAMVKLISEERGVVAMSNPSIATYRDLNCVEVMYCRKRQYNLARSFFTQMWIASTPQGPIIEDGYLCMDELADIACIISCPTLQEIKRIHSISTRDLQMLYTFYEYKADYVVQQMLKLPKSMEYEATFTFTPKPLIVVSAFTSNHYLGSFTVDLQGALTVVSATSSQLETELLGIKLLPSSTVIREEFRYELQS